MAGNKRHDLKNLFSIVANLHERLAMADTDQEKLQLLKRYAPLCDSALKTMGILMGFYDKETLEQLQEIKKEARGGQ